jgi:ribosomal protein L7/L12
MCNASLEQRLSLTGASPRFAIYGRSNLCKDVFSMSCRPTDGQMGLEYRREQVRFSVADELTDDQINQILNELQAGRKLAAVKLYKEWTGSSLIEAKNYVESLPAARVGGTADFGLNLEENQIDRILDAIQEGKKLEAVKLCKESSGLSLMESKKFVEHLVSGLGIEDRAGCAAGILLAVIVAAGAVLAVA